MSIKAYKGFNKDMTCRGFQYEEGKTYHEDEAKLCEKGFHACLDPLDCFRYYNPAESVFHEVELDDVTGENSKDSKVCGKTLKVGAALDIARIVKAKLDLTFKNIKKEKVKTGDYGASSATGNCGASSATGNYGASSATGNCGASSATGNCGASSATGYKGASSATGNCGASSATGNCGASSATGDYGASSATGDYGASSATGYKGASSATGNCGASSATGYKGASSAGNTNAVAVAWGYHGKARGVLGSYIVLAEWIGDENEKDNPSKWKLIGAKMHKVDGKVIKPDTWYELKNGKFVEVKDSEKENGI